MSIDNRGRSAHANGGATKVIKALFFGGSTPFLWASTKEMGSNRRTSHRKPPNVSAHTHKRKEKGEPPARVPPWTPSCAFVSIRRVPRSAERGQGRCPCTLPPLKRWTKLSFALTRAGSWSGARSGPGRASSRGPSPPPARRAGTPPSAGRAAAAPPRDCNPSACSCPSPSAAS